MGAGRLTPAMRFLTDFADQDVVLPIAGAVLLVLTLAGWWRGAAAWTATVTASFGTTLLLKLAFEACGRRPHHLIYSPSGHTMAGTVVYGGMLALLGLPLPASLAVALLVAALVGWSRVWLELHTVPEVLAGGALGLAGVAALRLLAGTPPARPRRRTALRATVLAVVAVLAALLHGLRSPAEFLIQDAARRDIGPLLRCEAS